MQRIGSACLFTLALIFGGLGWNGTPAAAAVAHLKTVLLPTSSVPLGLGESHSRAYTSFSLQLEVPARMGPQMTTSVCALNPTFRRDGWKEGVIEAFDRAAASSALQICASLFRTAAGAHSAYVLLVKRDINGPLSLKMVNRLKMSHIGNESTATWKSLKDCSCAASATGHTYQMVLRHDNAVVEIMFAGPLWATPERFRQLAATVNTQLR